MQIAEKDIMNLQSEETSSTSSHAIKFQRLFNCRFQPRTGKSYSLFLNQEDTGYRFSVHIFNIL